jgi:hypothetical protein
MFPSGALTTQALSERVRVVIIDCTDEQVSPAVNARHPFASKLAGRLELLPLGQALNAYLELRIISRVGFLALPLHPRGALAGTRGIAVG